jgi:hypothetical protein
VQSFLCLQVCLGWVGSVGLIMGDFMKEKLNFIEFLFKDLLKNAKIHVKNEEDYEKIPFKHYWENGNYRNKNNGKVALKRKITYLRQELLNLERMLE